MAAMVATVNRFYDSSIGKKIVMAISGVIGYGFVLVHMIGNLHMFEGRAEFNEYAHFLRVVGYPVFPPTVLLWIARIVLLAAVVVHIVAAVQLTVRDRASRPVAYVQKRTVQASFASLTLRWGGITLLLFIIFHLLHLTFGVVQPGFNREDPYGNVILGFQNPIIVLFYLLAMAALGMHMYHGVWSMFQTLGLKGPRNNPLWRGLAVASAVLLFVGFSLVPVAVITGLVK